MNITQRILEVVDNSAKVKSLESANLALKTELASQKENANRLSLDITALKKELAALQKDVADSKVILDDIRLRIKRQTEIR